MIISMAFNMHIGFNKGFFDYRKAVDKQFNDNLILTLESYYEENVSWDNLKGNRRLWHDIINRSSIELLNDENFRQQPLLKPQPRHHNNRSNPTNQRYRSKQLPPISLFNTKKEFIVGMRIRNKEKIKYKPLEFKSQVVGYLGLQKFKNVHFKQDKLFAANIENMLIRMGLLMIIIAVIVTFPIAKYFTKLINEITQATKKIAAGDYSIRIKSDRKDELGELASNFNLLSKSLQASSELQKKMIADIAHELRTPISVIIGEIEAIQDGIHDANENTMNLLHSQISSLKNLVNDLHDLSESDLGTLKYKMQEFDLLSLLKQCYQNYKLRFSQKNILLELQASDDQCIIFGDINRLNQLFNNLLSNSIQYTDKGGKAVIELVCHEDSTNVIISDSTPNLKNQQLDKIFDRWYRGEKSRNKNSGGSGLGLSICKEIVKAHNGTIVAKQSSLGGIKIIINLPRSITA